jgi:hypothetical protein
MLMTRELCKGGWSRNEMVEWDKGVGESTRLIGMASPG